MSNKYTRCYKVRKVGTYNYAITVPPHIANCLKDKDIYFHITDKGILLNGEPPQKPSEPITKVGDYVLRNNGHMVVIRCESQGIIGFNKLLNKYFAQKDKYTPALYSEHLQDCYEYLKSYINFNISFSEVQKAFTQYIL